MKTAISIPDDLFEQADALASRLGISRSQVYREALIEYLARRDSHAVTAALDAVVAELPDETDTWSRVAAHAALDRSEW